MSAAASEKWLCRRHIWLVGRMKFASLNANLSVGHGFQIILFFFLGGIPT